LGAFNVTLVETAEALARAAESARTPIVLQISENCVRYHGALRPIADATLSIARNSSAPISVHLDHATDRTLVSHAIALGFDSVMYDGAALPYERNLATTLDVVREARAQGVAVEAELGEVGGKNGAHAPGVRTKPDEALAFVDATGVDSLAVAVGSSHQMQERTSELDFMLIQALGDAVAVPLVLHGSSGVPDATIAAAVQAGITKVNISTHLNGLFTAAVRDVFDADPATTDPRRYIAAGRKAMTAETTRLLTLLATPDATRVSESSA
jgi:fructose-bisphosphate aldolase class II